MTELQESESTLGDPVKAWMARGRELKALGAECDRLRVEVEMLRDLRERNWAERERYRADNQRLREENDGLRTFARGQKRKNDRLREALEGIADMEGPDGDAGSQSAARYAREALDG